MHSVSVYLNVFILPTIGEPSRPPILAQMLMNPIDTAAADADIDMVGSTQNGEGQNRAQKPMQQSQNITTPNGCPGMRLMARNNPAPICPAMQCHLRSPVRSDDCPETKTPASIARYTRPRKYRALVGVDALLARAEQASIGPSPATEPISPKVLAATNGPFRSEER